MRAARAAATLREFIAGEAAGGVVLIAATALALLLANLPATAAIYEHLVHARTGPVLAPALGAMTVHLWINDGLMALFFLLVGLEIKREVALGELSSAERRRLPFVVAAAGMAVPALVYLAIVGDDAALRRGWAIPAATDIAFAMGMLALLGPRVPPALKLLLATVAVVDDMGAVAIIAVAYSGAIAWAALGGALATVLVLHVMARRGVTALWPYLLVGAVLWLFVLRSGVHATIAGVILAALVPIRADHATSPLHRLEHMLHPYVAFAIVPLFAFANAGIDLRGIGADTLAQPLVVAIAAGLFAGKQAGILGAIWASVRLGFARAPRAVSWLQLWGMALVAGIGFTMSLFVGGLAFPGDAALVAEVKLGVLLGSLMSAVAGVTVLALAPRPADRRSGHDPVGLSPPAGSG